MNTPLQVPNLLAPVAAYDAFASCYKSYSETRKSYLRSIEDIIIARAGAIGSLLDVGAGDGSRGLRIAKAVHAKRAVLLEPSAGMRSQCPEDAEIWPCRASEIPDTAPRFDLILCLWNVLGHIQGVQEKLLVLSTFRNLLAPGGVIFLDINHRYNAASYGWIRTLLRMVHDFFVRTGETGDVLVSWDAAGRAIRTRSHVFTQGEMKRLFRAAGLKIVARWVVDYESGAERKFPMSGHLLYEVTTA